MSYKNFINIPIANFRFSFYEINPEKVVVEYREEKSFFKQILFLNEKTIALAYLNTLRFLRGEFLPPFKQLLLSEGKKKDSDVIIGMFYSFPFEIKYLGLVENDIHSYAISVPIGFNSLKKEVVYGTIGIEENQKCSDLFLRNKAYQLIEEFRESVRTNNSEIYIW